MHWDLGRQSDGTHWLPGGQSPAESDPNSGKPRWSWNPALQVIRRFKKMAAKIQVVFVVL